ncbi:MAG: hypothetical protein FWH52_02055 [Synergistaceae bacterium]|nr:hypothetical protein [Synergistaceae bacterium]
MQAKAYEGYFENGHFRVSGKTIHIPERRRVFLTIMDEDVQDSAEEKEQRAAWLERLNNLSILSMDEELLYIPRSKRIREPVDLSE